jgi:hypothetical protein
MALISTIVFLLAWAGLKREPAEAAVATDRVA